MWPAVLDQFWIGRRVGRSARMMRHDGSRRT
jgi:hypothetical protein